MLVESAEAIHSGDHGLPVDRLFRAAERNRADLVAVTAHHLEVEPVAGALEGQLGKGVSGRPLFFKLATGGRLHLDGDLTVAELHVFNPLVSLSGKAGTNLEASFIRLVDMETTVGLGEDGDALSLVVEGRYHDAAHGFAESVEDLAGDTAGPAGFLDGLLLRLALGLGSRRTRVGAGAGGDVSAASHVVENANEGASFVFHVWKEALLCFPKLADGAGFLRGSAGEPTVNEGLVAVARIVLGEFAAGDLEQQFPSGGRSARLEFGRWLRLCLR